MKYLIVICLVALLVSFFNLVAQDNLADLRYEMNDEGKTTYMNFIFAHNFDRWTAEIFHVRQPQAEYNETTFGAGYNFYSMGEIAWYGLVHYTIASDANYLLPAIYAFDVDGKITGSLIFLYYYPFSDKGIHQVLIDPVEIQYNIWRSLSVGVSGYFWKPEEGDWFTKIGPKLSLADDFGSTELRIASVSDNGGIEFQLRRIILF